MNSNSGQTWLGVGRDHRREEAVKGCVHKHVDGCMLTIQLCCMYSMKYTRHLRAQAGLLPLLENRIIFNLTNPPWNTRIRPEFIRILVSVEIEYSTDLL